MLLREIHERGCEGGASQLRAWLARIKPAKRDDGPVVRFETKPGKQMQADFIVFRRAKSTHVSLRGDAGLQPDDLRSFCP